MESFLLFCNTAVMILAVALALVDENRKPDQPRTSPFRLKERPPSTPAREPSRPARARRRAPLP